MFSDFQCRASPCQSFLGSGMLAVLTSVVGASSCVTFAGADDLFGTLMATGNWALKTSEWTYPLCSILANFIRTVDGKPIIVLVARLSLNANCSLFLLAIVKG
jgi:hypothetical protein